MRKVGYEGELAFSDLQGLANFIPMIRLPMFALMRLPES
jgi:hypothetical protein